MHLKFCENPSCGSRTDGQDDVGSRLSYGPSAKCRLNSAAQTGPTDNRLAWLRQKECFDTHSEQSLRAGQLIRDTQCN